MERWQIFVACIVFIVIWMGFKRLKNKGGSKKPVVSRGQNSLERWYGEVQEKVALMDSDQRKERDLVWEGLPREGRLEATERFVSVTFGPGSLKNFDPDEILRVGRAQYLIDPDSWGTEN